MARALNTLTEAMPSQNARDVFRSKCGFAPCLVDQLDSTLFKSSDANLRYYTSFQQLMRELSTSDNVSSTNGLNEDYHLIPGDIVAVNPGTEDGIPSGDKKIGIESAPAPNFPLDGEQLHDLYLYVAILDELNHFLDDMCNYSNMLPDEDGSVSKV
ncbi:hypothetical protein ACROYT_G014559 [Oculina patagonica]